ncbi:MAG TPA: hypothetical protein VGC34_04830, partial [Steroidobacteraceae bacterium]
SPGRSDTVLIDRDPNSQNTTNFVGPDAPGPPDPPDVELRRSAPITLGSVLQGRFKLVESIGHGGMSAVFKAIDLRKVEARSSEPYVAVKLLTIRSSTFCGRLPQQQCRVPTRKRGRMKHLAARALVLCLLGAGGCTSRPPTIAHVHIGHAITGVHVTPNQEGYLVTAERRGAEAVELSRAAADSKDLAVIKQSVAGVVKATDSEDTFGVKQAIVMASNHISFAATSDDASVNVQQEAPVFASHITREVERCELIVLLGKDVAASSSAQEAAVSVAELTKLTLANVAGDDSNGDGIVGSAPSEYGLVQLRKELEGMIARDNPRYVTVPQWYLFNLVRLPNGRWVFDKLGRGGNIDGYK